MSIFKPRKMKIKRKMKKKEIVIFFSFLVLVLLLKYPILDEPHHWDSTIFMENALWYKYYPFNTIPSLDFGHFPLLLWLLGLVMRVTDSTIFIPHLIILGFSFLGVYFTYLLGKHLFSRAAGISAALILFFSPLYFSQSGIVQPAVPLTALTASAMYFYLKGNLKWFVIAGVALSLTKITGVLLIIALLAYFLYTARGRRRLNVKVKVNVKVNVKEFSALIIPIVFVGLWLVYYKINSAFKHISPISLGGADILKGFLHEGQVINLLINITQARTYNILEGLFYFSKLLFIDNFKFVLTAGILLVIVERFFFRKKGTVKMREGLLCIALTIAVYILVFSIYLYNLPRYILPVFPLFFVMVTGLVERTFRMKAILILTVVVIALFIPSWWGSRSDRCGCTLESNLEYLDMLETHKKAAEFIEENYPNSLVLTQWPMDFELADPELGYVKKRIRTKSYLFTGDNYTLEDVDIVYYSEQMHATKYLSEKMEKLDLKLMKRYEKNGKVAEVYEVIER